MELKIRWTIEYFDTVGTPRKDESFDTYEEAMNRIDAHVKRWRSNDNYKVTIETCPYSVECRWCKGVMDGLYACGLLLHHTYYSEKRE